MDALDLLLRLDALGVELAIDGDRLKVRGSLTDGLRQAIRQHKAELMELIHRRSDHKAQAQAITEALRARGWAPVSGGPFRGRIVVLVRDERVAVPEPWRQHERRTLKEFMEARGDNRGVRTDGAGSGKGEAGYTDRFTSRKITGK